MKFPEFEVTVGMKVNFYPGADRSQEPQTGFVQKGSGDRGIDILLLQNGTSSRKRNVYHVNHPEQVDHVERAQVHGGWDYCAGELKPWQVRALVDMLPTEPPKSTEEVTVEHRVLDLFQSATPIPLIAQKVGIKKTEVEKILIKNKRLEPAIAE